MSVNPLSGLLAAIEEIIPKEFIDGQNVREVADSCVYLDIDFSPVLAECLAGDPAINYTEDVPKPTEVVKEGERYCLVWSGNFQWINEESCKIMRARYLLLRGHYAKRLSEKSLSYPIEQKVLAYYFPHGFFDAVRLSKGK